MEQIIIHVDMDAFFASVEARDNPALRGKPLIIGSLPGERGVVATCSYEARKYGVHSAMNIKEAYRRCPQGIYMHPNIDKYKAISGQLHGIWSTYASAAEAIALDEAYLDVTQRAENLEGARRIAATIKQRTKDEIGLTCSVGVAYSKTAAKTASEEKKPNGYFEIPTPKDFVDLIIDRDVRSLYTVGEMTAEKLYASGIHTVRDIQEKQDIVIRLLGKQGQWITKLAFGIDERKVTPYRPQDAKSIGREVTFQEDVNNYELLKDVLVLLALCVERRASGADLSNGHASQDSGIYEETYMTEIKEKLFAYIKKKYHASPEYPWVRYPGYVAFRQSDNKKMFALVTALSENKLGLNGENVVDVLNVKVSDPFLADFLIRQEGFFRGHPIGRSSWVAIVLDGTVQFEEICHWLDESYKATVSKETKHRLRPPKEWIVPSNPKYYDVQTAFAESNEIDWKQGNGIKTGDTVFLYVAAPVSAILYKCLVTKTDIPFHFDNGEVHMSSITQNLHPKLSADN